MGTEPTGQSVAQEDALFKKREHYPGSRASQASGIVEFPVDASRSSSGDRVRWKVPRDFSNSIGGVVVHRPVRVATTVPVILAVGGLIPAVGAEGERSIVDRRTSRSTTFA